MAKFRTTINGLWYGVPLTPGTVEIPDHLVAKAASQPENFTKLGRPKKTEDEDAA